MPAIVMRGVSKELPWPGSRCGWIEVLNRRQGPELPSYVDIGGCRQAARRSARRAARSWRFRVFSATHAMRATWRRAAHVRRAPEEAYKILSAVPGLKINLAQGAFYMTALFEEGVLSANQTLPISDPELRDIVERQASTAALGRALRLLPAGVDRYLRCATERILLAAPGFRFTLLETDDAKRLWTLNTIAQAAKDYLESASE